MGYTEKIQKTKKNLIFSIIGSLVLVAITALIVYIVGHINQEQRIAEIEEEIVTHIYEDEWTYSSDYSYSEIYTEILLYENHTGKVNRDIVDERGGVARAHNGEIISWYIHLDFFGQEYITFDIKWLDDGDVSTWDNYEIARDSDGKISGLGSIDDDGLPGYSIKSYRYTSKTVNYTNNYLDDILKVIVFIACVIVCIPIFMILYYMFSRWDENRQLQAEEKRQKELELENRQKLLITMWEDQLNELGCKANDAVDVHYGSKFWVCDGKIYESESKYDFASRYLHNETEEPKVAFVSISVTDVQYFSKEGDVQYTTKVSGGGGGGSSIAGAIVGGLIAGEAGAVIGSRKQIQEVKSESVKHDTRQTILRYFRNSELIVVSYDGFNIYNYLLKKMPHKDLLTIQLNSSDNTISISKNEEDFEMKLNKLKKLHDSGILSDDEYETKKKDILDKI